MTNTTDPSVSQTLVRKPGVTKETTASWGNTIDEWGASTFDS